MRKISKLGIPSILAQNQVKWTQEYCDCLNRDEKPSQQIENRYNHKTIKDTLEKETYGKCIYCESKIKHITYGDIEHILPKNKNARPELYVDWDNLTLACEQCNRSGKGTYYNPQLPLINPYVDEPSQHLKDIGPLIMPVLDDKRGYVTVEVIKLNRMSLVERRSEKIQAIHKLLLVWTKETDESFKLVLEEQLHEEYTLNQEYSSTIKAYLETMGFPVKD